MAATTAQPKETLLGSFIDSLTTYVVAIFTLLFATILIHASAIMTVGGILLLALRLYVDGSRAWRTWQRNKDPLKRGDDDDD